MVLPMNRPVSRCSGVTRRSFLADTGMGFTGLALAAMMFSVFFGIPLGFIAAKRYGTAVDHASLLASLLGISIPIFFLAILLKYVFAVQLGWLPTTGRVDARIDFDHPTNFYLIDSLWTGDLAIFWDCVKHLILPAIALGSIPLAIIARITRAAVLDVQNEDYVRVARAKGLSPREVDSRHVLRNALLPVPQDASQHALGVESPFPAGGRAGWENRAGKVPPSGPSPTRREEI